MKSEIRVAIKAAGYNLAAIVCLVLMYVTYRKLDGDPKLFSVIIGVLGAIFGFLLSRGFSVKGESQLQQILGAALIREKEVEVRSVEEVKQRYETELEHLKEIIQQEGNRLLLRRLREVKLSDLRSTLREVEALDIELANITDSSSTEEVKQIKDKLAGMLDTLRNPEEDDRLIRQFCYSLPIFGNILYLLYMIGKKMDPTLQGKVHTKLQFLASEAANRRRSILKTALYIISILLILFLGFVIIINLMGY